MRRYNQNTPMSVVKFEAKSKEGAIFWQCNYDGAILSKLQKKFDTRHTTAMNAVEIESAISDLSAQPFERLEFPYSFLLAFGNKDTTIKRLRSGETNKSDVGGVLQAKNIHILATDVSKISQGLDSLRKSAATAKAKVRFLLATDGHTFEAEDLETGDTVVCDYPDFPDHFGFFLPLAGITTVKQIRESSFDIRATSRLNKLYLELLKDNPAWGKADRRHEMNHFMARLVFCFFAEDTDIFNGSDLFTTTVERLSTGANNTHEVISEIFRAMNVKPEDRASSDLPRWAAAFPYVNGGLFSGSTEVPHFSKIARTYLLHVGKLDWTKINPDIFGSMIQAVADDEERGSLGMHYTSVPNILKVLSPLFLDDLRAQLEAAGDNPRMLLNLRKRISKIRVFDPACGSGNFLVIAYKQMRELEHIINERRKEPGKSSDIPLTNFRGIELRDFPAEIARLALIIAEYQCNLQYLGQQEALADFLPLDSQNWITCGNALRLDWLNICPPTGEKPPQFVGDLFDAPQLQVEFENEGGETFICGNPPYKGSRFQETSQKNDVNHVASSIIQGWRSLDYVSGWMIKACEYQRHATCDFAFVTTSSICEGLSVSLLWPWILKYGQIRFAHRPFKWANLASNNAGVTVVIVGISKQTNILQKTLFEGDLARTVGSITPYLLVGQTTIVEKSNNPISDLPTMVMGAMPRDGGHLILSADEKQSMCVKHFTAKQYLRRYIGSAELTSGAIRYCLWIDDDNVDDAIAIPEINERLKLVSKMRSESSLDSTRQFSSSPHRFVYVAGKAKNHTIGLAAISSERREFLPVDILSNDSIASNKLFALYDASTWVLSILCSKIHLAWIATVCGRMRTDYSYSNTLGWNTFPLPTLTEKNKADLTRCAEDILLAREAHFPATIADLYDPETMPADLRAAHERNDEVLERIYIGRRFRNDTERLEKLFELYTKMTTGSKATQATKAKKGKKA